MNHPTEDRLQRYREIFWDAFHRPKLGSEPYFQLWQQLETINDYLAGPLFAVYEHGHCDYLFQDKKRFPEIHRADDLLHWCMEKVEQYRASVELTEVLDETQAQDKEVLLYQTDLKMELSEIAYQIQLERLAHAS